MYPLLWQRLSGTVLSVNCCSNLNDEDVIESGREVCNSVTQAVNNYMLCNFVMFNCY